MADQRVYTRQETHWSFPLGNVEHHNNVGSLGESKTKIGPNLIVGAKPSKLEPLDAYIFSRESPLIFSRSYSQTVQPFHRSPPKTIGQPSEFDILI